MTWRLIPEELSCTFSTSGVRMSELEFTTFVPLNVTKQELVTGFSWNVVTFVSKSQVLLKSHKIYGHVT